jgi:hypothetical protein
MLLKQKLDSSKDSRQRNERLVLWPLPVPSTKRWTIRRKAELVAAVGGGLMTIGDACQLYHLSVEEFEGWQTSVARSGAAGLRVTRIKHYRELHKSQRNCVG